MEKPRNKWAITMWVLAALFAAGESSEIVSFIVRQPHILSAIWLAARSAFVLVYIATLAGLGILIEMTDQVRWDLRSLSERVKAAEKLKL